MESPFLVVSKTSSLPTEMGNLVVIGPHFSNIETRPPRALERGGSCRCLECREYCFQKLSMNVPHTV